jgi:hypothetical protein
MYTWQENVGGFLVTSLIVWGGMRAQFELWKYRYMREHA